MEGSKVRQRDETYIANAATSPSCRLLGKTRRSTERIGLLSRDDHQSGAALETPLLARKLLAVRIRAFSSSTFILCQRNRLRDIWWFLLRFWRQGTTAISARYSWDCRLLLLSKNKSSSGLVIIYTTMTEACVADVWDISIVSSLRRQGQNPCQITTLATGLRSIVFPQPMRNGSVRIRRVVLITKICSSEALKHIDGYPHRSDSDDNRLEFRTKHQSLNWDRNQHHLRHEPGL